MSRSHRRRRAEGIPLLEAKFKTNLAILVVSMNQAKLEAMPANEHADPYVI
jgi:2-methylcitrate dehydratase